MINYALSFSLFRDGLLVILIFLEFFFEYNYLVAFKLLSLVFILIVLNEEIFCVGEVKWLPFCGEIMVSELSWT